MFDVLTTEDFSFRAEVDEFAQVVLHMDVYKWSPRTAREIRSVFKDAKEAFRLEGFSRLYTITTNPKFVRMIGGGESLGKLPHLSREYEVISWEIGD